MNGILNEKGVPEDWKSSTTKPICKGKGDPVKCDKYIGVRLLDRK